MNKTVKTIAWICLVLGLLGIAVDIGMYVRARTSAAQIAEQIEAGDLPAMGRRFEDRDEDADTDVDAEGFRMRPGKGRRRIIPGGGSPHFQPGRIANRSSILGLPLLLVAAGPVLTVVGAVMLIVNREPREKQSDSTAKKAKKVEKEAS
jgi:hypothetical protein